MEQDNIIVSTLTHDMTLSTYHKQCKLTQQGANYTGTVKQSARGTACLEWYEYTHILQTVGISADDFPDSDLITASNFCRNPSNLLPYGPWCFTDPDNIYHIKYCNISYCSDVIINHRECKSSVVGMDYTGTVAHTKEGYKCDNWSNQTEVYDFLFPDINVLSANSYCTLRKKVRKFREKSVFFSKIENFFFKMSNFFLKLADNRPI